MFSIKIAPSATLPFAPECSLAGSAECAEIVAMDGPLNLGVFVCAKANRQCPLLSRPATAEENTVV